MDITFSSELDLPVINRLQDIVEMDDDTNKYFKESFKRSNIDINITFWTVLDLPVINRLQDILEIDNHKDTTKYFKESFKRKRNEREGHLEERIHQKPRLAAQEPPVLEDLQPEEEEDKFPELTLDMETRINDALRPYPPSEVLSDGFHLKITRKDMETLSPVNWLNDDIINFYMEMLRERGAHDKFPSVHVFNTFFYPLFLAAGHGGVKRWTRRVDIFAHDFIVVPVHLGRHWCLAIVDLQKKAIRYFDSMGGNNMRCVRAVKEYLEDESMDKKKTPLNTSEWSLDIVKDIPQQMNSSDCGVFTCKYADYLVRRKPITFTQEHMPYFRRRMVYEILTKQLL